MRIFDNTHINRHFSDDQSLDTLAPAACVWVLGVYTVEAFQLNTVLTWRSREWHEVMTAELFVNGFLFKARGSIYIYFTHSKDQSFQSLLSEILPSWLLIVFNFPLILQHRGLTHTAPSRLPGVYHCGYQCCMANLQVKFTRLDWTRITIQYSGK